MSIGFNRKSILALAIASLFGGSALVQTGRAAVEIDWSGGTSVTWATATNWNLGSGPAPTSSLTLDIAGFTSSSAYTFQPTAGTTSIAGLLFTGSAPVTLAGTQLSIGGSGISMSGSAGTVTISSPIALGADQTWSNISSSLLTISGTTATNGWNLTLSTTLGGGISWAGTNVRDNNGLRTLTLDGANTGIVTITGTYVTGDGTFVENGTLKAGGAISIDGSLTLGSLGNAATLDLNGNSITVGGLAVDGAATAANQIITNTGATGKILTVDTTLANSTFSGIIQNGGANTIGLTKAGINTLTLTGDNTYNGITSGTRGTLEFQGQPVGVTQSLGALAFTTGGINIQSTYGTSGTTTLAFTGTLARTAGATGDFILSGGNSSNNIITVGTTVTTAGGAISSPGFFFGTGANTQYAVQTLGVISGFTGGTPITDINTGLTPTVNYISSSFSTSSTLSANASANTLQYTGPAQTITTNGNKLILNGILNAGTGKLSITGSSTTDGVVAGSSELVLNAANGDIELSALTGAASGNTIITIAGPNNLYLNQVNDPSTGTVTFDNGSATSVNGLVIIGASRTLSLNHPAGTGGITLNVAVADSPTGSSSVIATGAGTGTFTLAAGNTFTGSLINESSADVNATNASSLSRDNDVVVNAVGAFTAGISGGLYIAGLDDMAPGQSGITGGNVAAATSGMSFNLAGTGNYSFSGVISSAQVALVKTGTGTQNLSGKNSYTNASGTSVNGGILNLDFSQSAATGIHPLTNILYNGVTAGILSLGGGTLVLTGGSAAPNSQAFSTLTVGAGGAQIQLLPNASTPESLLATFTTISESAGGTVDFALPGTAPSNQTAANGITTTASANSGTTGILGGWATVGGADWATSVSNGTTFNIDPLPSASYTTFVGTGAGDTAAVNAILPGSGSVSPTAATDTVNSLKIAPSGSGSLAIATGKTLTLTSGGLLFTGSSDYSITGADATSKLNGTNLIIQQFAAANNLTIGAVITGTTLTKSGPGTLTLTAANATTGTVNLNGGITNINALAALGTGTAINFNGGTLQYASPSAASPFSGSGDITTRTITFNGNGAVIDTNGNNIVYNNVNSATAPSFGNAGAGGFTKTGSGTLTLTGVSAYFGPTTISGGVLSIGGGAIIAGQNRLVTTLSNGDNGFSLGDVTGLYIGQSITGPLIHGGAAFITSINAATGLVVYTGGSGGNSADYFAGFSPLGDGGMTNSSSIGVSSPAAANLILDGGTLQYTGLAQSTNRLFTVTANGGGIDASGASNAPLVFTSIAPLAFTGAGDRTLTLSGSSTGGNTLNPVISNPTSGNTLLTKSGGGTWILTATNTYTGITTITGGTLALSSANNNIAGSSKIIVGDSLADAGAKLDVTGVTNGFVLGGNQTLAGHGTVVGNVTTSSGSVLAPGNTIGTTSYSANLTLAAGTVLDYEFAGSSSSDDSLVTGLLTLPTGTGSITLNMTDAGGLTAGTFKIFGYGTLAGGAPSSLNATFAIDPPSSPALAGATYDVVNNMGSSELDLVISGTAVPEPASLALLGLGAAGLLLRRRRRA